MLNQPLLREVARQILAHPQRFDLTEFRCGTTGCIAGWCSTVAQIHPKAEPSSGLHKAWVAHGAQLLGITEAEALSLFYLRGWHSQDTGWPADWTQHYHECGICDDASVRLCRAQVTHAYIHYWIGRYRRRHDLIKKRVPRLKGLSIEPAIKAVYEPDLRPENLIQQKLQLEADLTPEQMLAQATQIVQILAEHDCYQAIHPIPTNEKTQYQ